VRANAVEMATAATNTFNFVLVSLLNRPPHCAADMERDGTLRRRDAGATPLRHHDNAKES
jgi:hypothetical protein